MANGTVAPNNREKNLMLEFKPNMLTMFLVIGAILLMGSVDVFGQEATNTEKTLLDPLPESFNTIPQNVCEQLYCPRYFSSSWPRLDSHDGEIGYSAMILGDPNAKPCDSSVYVNCGASTVLSWQRWEATNMLLFDSTVVWEDHVFVLYRPKEEVDSDVPRWKLLYMMRIQEGTRWYTIEASEYIKGKPSNEAIYRLIEDWTSKPRNFFSFDSEKNKAGKWITEYKGIKLELVAGDVREKTWEAVIGEKPTKFFPELKE